MNKIIKNDQGEIRYIISIFVENLPGVLCRVVGMLSGRGYNIESLTVKSISKDANISKMNIVTYVKEENLNQMILQIKKIVPVYDVNVLNNGDFIEKEACLFKINKSSPLYSSFQGVVNEFNASIVEDNDNCTVASIYENEFKIDDLIEKLLMINDVEIVRSGAIAISSGGKV